MEKWMETAKWIWLEEKGGLNQYVDFRQTFTVDAGETAVRLYISADSRYAAFINGVHLPLSQYADYPTYKVYDSLDVTAWIHPGENVLSVVGYSQGEDSSVYRLARAGLLFAVTAGEKALAASGSATLCRLSRDYQSGDMERHTPQLSFSFRYDARKADNWMDGAYTPDGNWVCAAEIPQILPLYPRPVKDLCLHPRKTAKIAAQGIFIDGEKQAPCGVRMQHAYLSARTAEEMGAPEPLPVLPCPDGATFRADSGDGVYLLVDLGCEEAGLLDIELSLPEPAEMLIGFGEHLDDLRVRTSVGGRQFAAVYEGKSGSQRFTHYFKRLGCRYIMLYVYARVCTVTYIGLRPVTYPLDYRPLFRCDDELHNRIAAVSRRTLELCMHEHYEDCPWREQALYAMDSRNQMLIGYYTFGEVAFAQANLRLLAEGLREDGLLELCAPARVAITIPAFSLSFIQAVEENVAYSRDVAFAESMMPTVERILDTFLRRREDNGLIASFTEACHWNFYEWREGLDGGAFREGAAGSSMWDAPLHGWLLMAVMAAAKLWDRLGRTDQAQAYRRHWEQLCAAAEAGWEEEKGAYATYLSAEGRSHYCQLTQSLLLVAGAVPEERRERLLETLAHDKSLIPVSLSHSIYKYDALMTAPEKYGRFVMDEIGRVWGEMLFRGATSFWETEQGADDFEKAGSLCHGWSAIPLYVYHRYILGEVLDGAPEE